MKFRNAGLRFANVEALIGFFSRFGDVKDFHLEDEMPVEDQDLDDGKYRYLPTRNGFILQLCRVFFEQDPEYGSQFSIPAEYCDFSVVLLFDVCLI